MDFSEKIKTLRKSKKLTQAQVALAIGVPLRTYQTYEAGTSHPKNARVYNDIAGYYEVSLDYLMGTEERYITKAGERGGADARRQVALLLSRADGLFAGGELTEEDKELVIKSLYDLYWDAKEKNRKKNGGSAGSGGNGVKNG